MITLPTNISDNNMKAGTRPSVLVTIDDSSKYWSTSTFTEGSNVYANRINRTQRISQSIDQFGGMATVSSANVEVGKGGESVTFGTSTTITPRAQAPLVGAGRLYAIDATTYATARGATTATNLSDVDITIGQSYVPALGYYVYRGYLQFDIPAGMTTCEHAFIRLSGQVDNDTTDFDVYVVEGEWTTDALNVGSFGGATLSFDGWQAGSTAYDGTRLNETWNASYFSITSDNLIRFNRTGRDLIVSKTGTTLKLMLLSSRDYAGTFTPTGDEYIRFNGTASTTLELIYNTVKPDNRRTRIYLGYRDSSDTLPASTSSMLNIWSGVTDRYTIKESTLDLRLKHDDFKRNVLIPKKILTRSYGSFSRVPDDSVGKPIPIIVGDFTLNPRHKDGIGYVQDEHLGGSSYYGLTRQALGYAYYPANPNSDSVYSIFAQHDCKELEFYPTVYETGVSSHAILASIVTDVSTSGTDTKVKIDKGSGRSGKWPHDCVSTDETPVDIQPVICYTPKAVIDLLNVSDYANALSDVPDEYISIGNAPPTELSYVTYSFGKGYNVSQLFDNRYICFNAFAPGATYNNNQQLVAIVRYFGQSGQTTQTIGYINADGNYWLEIDPSWLPADADSLSEVSILFYATANAFTTRISNIALCAGYRRDEYVNIGMAIKGYKDDGTGNATGTADALIEIPSDVILGLAGFESELSFASDFDTTSFTTARTTFSAWKYAFELFDERRYLFTYGSQSSVIGDLAYQSNSFVFFDYLGKLKIAPFLDTNGFANSGTDIPSDADIFKADATISSDVFTQNPIMPNSFSLEQIDIDDVYNSFEINYDFDPMSETYNEVLYMDSGLGVKASIDTNVNESNIERSQTLDELKYYTSNSYNEIQKENKLKYDAWAIQDEATATKFLQRLIEWNTRRRYVVKLTTKMTAVWLELGDFINIRHDDIQDQFGESEMNIKKWKVTDISIDLNEFTMDITAIEARIY